MTAESTTKQDVPHWVKRADWPNNGKLPPRSSTQCVYHVFTGERGDTGGHQCRGKASAVREGWPVCAAHKLAEAVDTLCQLVRELYDAEEARKA